MHGRTPPRRHELHPHGNVGGGGGFVAAGQLQMLRLANKDVAVGHVLDRMEERVVPVEMPDLPGEAGMRTVDHLHHVLAVQVVAERVQGGRQPVHAALLQRARAALHHFA